MVPCETSRRACGHAPRTTRAAHERQPPCSARKPGRAPSGSRRHHRHSRRDRHLLPAGRGGGGCSPRATWGSSISQRTCPSQPGIATPSRPRMLISVTCAVARISRRTSTGSVDFAASDSDHWSRSSAVTSSGLLTGSFFRVPLTFLARSPSATTSLLLTCG